MLPHSNAHHNQSSNTQKPLLNLLRSKWPNIKLQKRAKKSYKSFKKGIMETKEDKQIVSSQQSVEKQVKFVTKFKFNRIPDYRKLCRDCQTYRDCSHDKQKCFMWFLSENGMCQHQRRRKYIYKRLRQGHINHRIFPEKMSNFAKIYRAKEFPFCTHQAMLKSLRVATMWK